MNEFTERVCIVTGGTRGLGRTIVNMLLEAGALVLATGRSEESAARLRESLDRYSNSLAVIGQDMRAPEAGDRLVEAAVSRFGQLDVVINNASATDFRDTGAGVSRNDWLGVFETKLLGYWMVMAAAIPELLKTKGCVVNVAGGGGLVAAPNSPHVAAVNAGVISVTESYGLKLAGTGVRVNCITPSTINNERFASRVASIAEKSGIGLEEARAQLNAKLPVGFPTDPEEIARVVLFLCSAESRSITGANFIVDGAGHLRGGSRSS